MNRIASVVLLLTLSLFGAERQLQRGRDWTAFTYPTITIKDKDNGTSTGSQLVARLIPDLEGFIEEIALGVCKSLYKEVSEVPVFDELVFELEYREGVAYKAGSGKRITVNLSTKYLEEQYQSGGDEAILYEIAGVNWHELTHAYQHVPQNCGSYKNGTEFFGFIEGTADAVRILAGYHNTRKPHPGGSWKEGYTTSGFFIEWLQKNRDPEFLYKLNQSCLTYDPWSYDQACQEIFGVGVQRLWDEYQWFLKGGGAEAAAQFSADKQLLCKGESVQFTNRSLNEPTAYEWTFEGGTPAASSAEHPLVQYDTPGTYAVSLRASNSSGSTESVQAGYITVATQSGTMLVLTEPGGAISSDVSSPFAGEDVTMLIDGEAASKFCVKDGTLWVEYDCPKAERPFGYSFTAASDAAWRDPQNWQFYGAKNGSWELLGEESGVTFSKRGETQLFRVDTKERYSAYRWEIAAQTDTMFQLAELVLYGIDEPTVSVVKSVVASAPSVQLNGRSLALPAARYRGASLFSAKGQLLYRADEAALATGRIGLEAMAPGLYLLRLQESDATGVTLRVQLK
ncbi:MAG: PKD domain-containing protein [bacterium]|nr:PKD domain-containing protein [bacterium]